jgi:hypothetical protein
MEGNKKGMTQSKEVKLLSTVAELFRLGFENSTGIRNIFSIDRVHIYICRYIDRYMAVNVV